MTNGNCCFRPSVKETVRTTWSSSTVSTVAHDKASPTMLTSAVRHRLLLPSAKLHSQRKALHQLSRHQCVVNSSCAFHGRSGSSAFSYTTSSSGGNYSNQAPPGGGWQEGGGRGGGEWKKSGGAGRCVRSTGRGTVFSKKFHAWNAMFVLQQHIAAG